MLSSIKSEYTDTYAYINNLISETGTHVAETTNAAIQSTSNGVSTSIPSNTTASVGSGGNGLGSIGYTNTANGIVDNTMNNNTGDGSVRGAHDTESEAGRVHYNTLTPSSTYVLVEVGDSKTVSIAQSMESVGFSVKTKDKSVATTSNGGNTITIKGKSAGKTTVTLTPKDGGAKVDITIRVTNVAEFMSTRGHAPTKDISKYNDVNEKLYAAYGKVLSESELKELAKHVGVKDSDYTGEDKNKSTGKLYQHLHKLRIKGFKSGTPNVPSNMLAWTQEKGSEIIYNSKYGKLTALGADDMVFTHEMSKNLWDIAKNYNILNAGKLGLGNMQGINIENIESKAPEITVSYDSLLNIDSIGTLSEDTLPKLKSLLQQSYEYTSKQMMKDFKKLGWK